MKQEEIDKMVSAYVEKYVDRFKKVASQSYLDGMLDAIEFMRKKMKEL